MSSLSATDYYDRIITVPFEESVQLRELGPQLRLQILFKLVNLRYSDMDENRGFVADELFRNLN